MEAIYKAKIFVLSVLIALSGYTLQTGNPYFEENEIKDVYSKVLAKNTMNLLIIGYKGMELKKELKGEINKFVEEFEKNGTTLEFGTKTQSFMKNNNEDLNLTQLNNFYKKILKIEIGEDFTEENVNCNLSTIDCKKISRDQRTKKIIEKYKNILKMIYVLPENFEISVTFFKKLNEKNFISHLSYFISEISIYILKKCIQKNFIKDLETAEQKLKEEKKELELKNNKNEDNLKSEIKLIEKKIYIIDCLKTIKSKKKNPKKFSFFDFIKKETLFWLNSFFNGNYNNKEKEKENLKNLLEFVKNLIPEIKNNEFDIIKNIFYWVYEFSDINHFKTRKIGKGTVIKKKK